MGGCPAQWLHWQAGKGRGAGSFPRAAAGPVVPWALHLGIVAAGTRPWHISCPSPTVAPAAASLVEATDFALMVHELHCAADFTGLPGTPGLQLTAPNHCTPQPDTPQPGTPGHCITQHPTSCAWLGTGGSVGRAGVQGGGQGTGKLLCRLSARARGRRSLPRAVCSGSVPRGVGTTSNRAEPGRCLREGTEMLTVPPGTGHPWSHCRHLIAWATQVASSTRDHPVTDAGAQGVWARGLSAVHVPLSPLPRAQGCTLCASTALSAQSLVHVLHVCPWEG